MRRAGAAATAALLLATATALDASVAGAIDVRWAVAARASVEIRFKMQGTDAQRSRFDAIRRRFDAIRIRADATDGPIARDAAPAA